MKISLITATLGRVDEIKILLNSLKAQTYTNFEIIIIDQNEHLLVKNIVDKFETLHIKYIRSNIKGLSYNRNLGIKLSQGNIVAFPDDDCYYDKNVLMEVNNAFESNQNLKLCAFPVFDTINTDMCYLSKKGQAINRYELYKYCISINFFLKKNLNIYFDERLGVGTYFSSGEETDFLLSNLKKQDLGIFIKNSSIYHIYNKQTLSADRAYKYGLGFGALFKKEIYLRKNLSFIFLYWYYIVRSIIGILIIPSKSNIYFNTLKGRILGFLKFKI